MLERSDDDPKAVCLLKLNKKHIKSRGVSFIYVSFIHLVDKRHISALATKCLVRSDTS